MTRQKQPEKKSIDTELADLTPELRWREWMMRVEAVIFAASEPVGRDALARVVGRDCNLDLIIDDIRDELRGRPYELAAVAGGWQHRSRPAYAPAIRASQAPTRGPATTLSEFEAVVLMAIAYFQPITRRDLSKIFGKEISRDTIGHLRAPGFIAAGPRSPTPGAPYTYVTTRAFLSQFGFDTLRDLPDREMLEDAGLLSREKLLDGDIPVAGDEMDEADDEIGAYFEEEGG